ncbi:MAG: FtsL-like putative cell division protein [Anditalea sp.]
MAENTFKKKIKPIGPKREGNLFTWIEDKTNISGLIGEGVPVKLVPPLLYAAFLALIYIWSNHRAENTIRKIEVVQQEVEDLRADVTTLEADYMYSRKQSEVAKKIMPLGIYEIEKPPLKIIVEK